MDDNIFDSTNIPNSTGKGSSEQEDLGKRVREALLKAMRSWRAVPSNSEEHGIAREKALELLDELYKLEDSAMEEMVKGLFPNLEETSSFRLETERNLTPTLLATELSQYLLALQELQAVIDELNGNEWSELRIRAITQQSLLTIFATVGPFVQEFVSKIDIFRLRYAARRAKLEVDAMELDIEQKRAESALTWEEVKTKRLENEHARRKLLMDEIGWLREEIQSHSPNLSEQERTYYTHRLLPPFQKLAMSNLRMSIDSDTSEVLA